MENIKEKGCLKNFDKEQFKKDAIIFTAGACLTVGALIGTNFLTAPNYAEIVAAGDVTDVIEAYNNARYSHYVDAGVLYSSLGAVGGLAAYRAYQTGKSVIKVAKEIPGKIKQLPAQTAAVIKKVPSVAAAGAGKVYGAGKKAEHGVLTYIKNKVDNKLEKSAMDMDATDYDREM